MKKIVLITALVVVAFSWAVYELVSSSDDNTAVEDTDNGDTGKGTITGKPGENDEMKQSDDVGISEGEIAPDFELKTLHGEKASLKDYRGTPVIINFWATWCPPCRAEIPDLQDIYEDKDVVILGINLTETESGEGDIQPFIDDLESDMDFPVLLDKDLEVAETYNVKAYPTSYFVDPEGHIKSIVISAMNYDLMEKELEKMD